MTHAPSKSKTNQMFRSNSIDNTSLLWIQDGSFKRISVSHRLIKNKYVLILKRINLKGTPTRFQLFIILQRISVSL